MKPSNRRFRCTPTILLLLSFSLMIFPSGAAIAGTTGSLSGTVTDADSRAPIAGAKVTATSPSETVSATTDAGGRFNFVSLAPDEYTVAVQRDNYNPASVVGVAIFADATQVVSVTLHKALRTIANVVSRSASDLLRPGTTADVYSINAAQQQRANVLGGGGDLNSAFSAIATVPGAYVPANQAGYLQAVHVRGGDSYEVGYEFDGIPVNRGFDNYPSSGLSSLGQLELQVYTGATPANGEAQGLAGFINQVIKTGTYPGYGAGDAALGTPTFYHSLSVEAGGASPDRRFSYYVGVGGFNQDHRYVDQFNGASYASDFGPPLDQCQPPPLAATAPPSCFTNGQPNVSQAGAPGYILGPIPFGNNVAAVNDRTFITNFHFRIPHRNDGGSDDVQLLYDSDSIFTPLYVSPLDEGLNNFQGSLFYPQGTLPYYTDSYQYNGAPGSFVSANGASQITPYYFPSSPTNREMFAPLALTTRDVQYNNQNIVKLQYQKNFSSNAYLRLYGYTYYSNYVATGAVSSWQPLTGFDGADYELSSHTRGVSAEFAEQLSHHLLQAQASYTTSTALRMFNTQMYDNADAFAVVVNPNSLTHGICYALPTSGNVATPTTCNSGNVLTVGTPATFASLANSFGQSGLFDTNGNAIPNLSGMQCGNGPCSLYTVENGPYGEYNNVKPNFTGYSLTDEYRPNDKLSINYGLRLDSYQFVGDDTTGTAARAFWFNSFNNDTCFDTQNLTLYDKTSLVGGTSIPVNAACSTAGPQYVAATMYNTPSQQFTYNILQPRIGATYSVDPYTVLRASWGKYNEQPTSAYEQYDALQQNLPDQLIPYYSLGFNTPGHQIYPSISYNTDFSFEHHFKGTSITMKVTPFLRQTKNEIENFYLNIKSGLVSGFNAGEQTSDGVEFALNEGDFARNGFASQLSFTYTNVYVHYNTLPNGSTVLSPINADIQTYNAYTSFCATHASDKRCGSTTLNGPAAPCYTSAGVPDSTCGLAGDVANPYWNAPVQPLLDPNANYLPYSTLPGGVGTGVNAYNYPYVATLILNYKHNRWAITPSFQFVAGNRYGAPEVWPGIDPAQGCSALTSTVSGDPRYPYGAPGGSPYDATTCAGQLSAIPDPYTGHFDNIGEFREPAQLLGHLRLSYDLNDRISLNVTVANLINQCFGGQQTPFTYFVNRYVCSYGNVAGQLIPPVGNVYNPGDNVQTILRYPYQPIFGTYNDLTTSTDSPISVYFSAHIKI